MVDEGIITPTPVTREQRTNQNAPRKKVIIHIRGKQSLGATAQTTSTRHAEACAKSGALVEHTSRAVNPRGGRCISSFEIGGETAFFGASNSCCPCNGTSQKGCFLNGPKLPNLKQVWSWNLVAWGANKYKSRLVQQACLKLCPLGAVHVLSIQDQTTWAQLAGA